MTGLEAVPVGTDAVKPSPGDVIFCHRPGVVSAIIRWGQRFSWVFHWRSRSKRRFWYWSHVATVDEPLAEDTEPMIIEALTSDVARGPLSKYRDIEYAIARTHLTTLDRHQVSVFLRSCVGTHYAWATIVGTFLRYLTPGRGPVLVGDLCWDCSSLSCEAECRGPAIYPHSPAAMTPAEMAAYHDA